MSENLEQHRRELDATYEVLAGLRTVAEHELDDGVAQWRAIAELRDGLRALSNRVGALTLSLADDNTRHSVGAEQRFVGASLLVVNLEADPPIVLGSLVEAGDETVSYSEAGDIRRVVARDTVALVSPTAAARLTRRVGRR